jgi:hypothetical protein
MPRHRKRVESDEPAIQRSRRPHSQRQPGISDSPSRRTLTCLHRKRIGYRTPTEPVEQPLLYWSSDPQRLRRSAVVELMQWACTSL